MGRTGSVRVPASNSSGAAEVSLMQQRREGESATERNDLNQVYQELQRRDWELWSIVVILCSLFAAGFLFFYYAGRFVPSPAMWSVTQFNWWVLLGLVALVAFVNVYLINSKRKQLKQLRDCLLRAEREEEAREQRARDPLTQLYCRRFFDEVIPHEARRCDRLGRPLAFLLIEICNLKKINEELGHLTADELLKTVANVLQTAVRSSDYVFRFGGDEFMLVLPETPPEGAAVVERRVQERLRQNETLQNYLGRQLEVTMASTSYQRGLNLAAVVEQAEQTVFSQRSAAGVW